MKPVKGKGSVRYLDFTSAPDGSRVFHFSISTDANSEAKTTVEMPVEFMIGMRRVPLPDCVRISYAKLQRLVELDGSQPPRKLRLTAADILEFSQPVRRLSGRRAGRTPAP